MSLFMIYSFVLAAVTLPSALAATVDVSVGDGALRFNPEFITASPGDVVNFVFHPKAHSVTQSSFASPCSPLSGGFDSGLMPVAAGTTDLPSYQVKVNDTNPVWVYCKQPGPPAHCGQGMVFAINAPADPNPHSFSAFQALANATASNTTSNSITSAATSTSTSAYVTPPPPSFVTVTATVTLGASTWTTTYASYDGTPPPTPAAQPVEHEILVGANNQLAFSPPNITASIGDTVKFSSTPRTTVVITQSSFLKPCNKLADATTGDLVGFDSGFMFIDPSAPVNQTTFTITVNTTAPIWGYCRQTNPVDHCGSGMVFSINAVESGPNNFAAFQALAKQINGTSTASGSGSSTGSGTASSSTSTSTKSGGARIASINTIPMVIALVLCAGVFGVVL